MVTKYERFFEKDYQRLLEKYDKKSEEYKQLKYEYQPPCTESTGFGN